MVKLKLLFWIVGLGVLASVGAYYFSQNSDSLIASKIQPVVAPLQPYMESIPVFTSQIKIPEDTSEISTLTERGKEITTHVGAVLGESVSVVEEDEQRPLHERALEYGQYMYCKGIVEEYEAVNTSN